MVCLELLVPAGNMASFIAAVNHGADAIYLSGKSFGARSFAPNFTMEELEQVLHLGKIYGVKVYVTMNTLIKDGEVEEFLRQVEFLYHHGVDAIIMQDFGMISLCLEKYPNLVIHASTQMNSSTIKTIELLYQMGVKRVVLPRELTKEEIEKITVPIEIEVFIHGALCVSYSGCCLFSQRLGGRSGNRGECAGSCRQRYQLYLKDQKIKDGYLLSMKELKVGQAISLLPSNVTSLKIEGRMKSASYVAFITSYYRQILDGQLPSPKQEEDLQSLFYRGFTRGHLFEEKELINPLSPNHIGLKIGKVIRVSDDKVTILLQHALYQNDGIRFANSKKGMIVNFLYNQRDQLIHHADKGQTIMVDNKVGLKILDDVCLTSNSLLDVKEDSIIKKVPIEIQVIAKAHQPLQITFKDSSSHVVSYKGEVVEVSKNQPVTRDRIEKQIAKLGNTPFVATHITIESDDAIFVRMGDINVARRILSERLIGVLLNDYPEPIINEVTYSKVTRKEFGNLQQYQIIPRNEFSFSDIKDFSALSNVMDVHGRKVIGTYHLNVYNAYTAYYLYRLGYLALTVSIELSEKEIMILSENVKTLFGDIPLLVKTSGRVEVMLIKSNIMDLEKGKTYDLVDLHYRHFPVFYDGTCTHVLSNDEVHLEKEKLPSNCFVYNQL